MLFIEDGAPVIVQGMTGHQGMTHTARMLKAGTNIVGGVNARKAGQEVTFPEAKNGADVDTSCFGSCSEAVEITGAQASVVFVPPSFAKAAVVEAVEAGIKLIVVITEGIPVADVRISLSSHCARGVRIVGPNCPGLITLPSTENRGLQSRHHSGRHRLPWTFRTGVQVRHPYLSADGGICPTSASLHASALAAIPSLAPRCRRPWRIRKR